MAIDFVKKNEGSEIQYAAVKAKNISEKKFEDYVERMLGLTGWRTTVNGVRSFPAFKENADAQKDYDRSLALKVDSLIGFVKETQPKEWAKIERMYGMQTKERFLKRVCDVLQPHDNRDGLINVLRRGFKMAPGADFKLCYFKPASTLNSDLQSKYEANRLEVVRQLRYGTLPDNKGDSIDTVLFLNGIPIVTMELKNNLSGQRTEHAVEQYKHDRSPKELIFKPNRRSIVHFAFDSETVAMTTWLANSKTVFLPFNKGNGKFGGGNPAPENGEGYRTEYLYREILAPDSLLDIIQRFVRVDYDSKTKAMKRVIFPRYHQLDVVRKLVADAKENGSGKSYLIQHSAGSGKSNSIAWLAHHLSSLHDVNDNAVFDTVVVLTDRRNLDSQLSETIESVDHKRGVVKRVTSKEGSAGLRDALNSGSKIITSTIQKFPYICSETKVSGKKFAVIIDEAHSSQSGKANAKMKMALIDKDVDPDEQWDSEDELAKEMAAQGTIPNLSFFAFTATPKASTLEVFGTRDEKCHKDKDGMLIPRPFHLYSMKQAIDEKFILDVLENYTCFQTYFKLVKTIQDDPRFKEMKANRALMGIVNWNPRMIEKKAEIITEHFMSDVEGLLGHRSKAMVVTSSRPMAYRLYCGIRDYIAQNHYDCKVMIAFSGSLEVDNKEVTEASVNGVPESQTAEVFDGDDKRIIVCANKFQTGFDQPKLCAMYVDKMLTGVTAVQTLSRLNRTCSIPGKRTFVLDFVNDWETIRASFSSYYEVTEIDAVTDPNVIYDLKERLDSFYVYDQVDVDVVANLYYTELDSDKVQSEIEGRLAPAVDKWTALEDNSKKTFKALLKKFLRSYSFITQMCKLGDKELHGFFVYAGFLIKKLFLNVSGDVELRDKVELEYLRIEDKGTKSIKLESEELHNGGANAGITHDDPEEYLSELVRKLNEAFGTEWEDADKVMRAVSDKILENETFVAQAKSNSMNDLKAIFGDVMMNALLAILSDSQDMAAVFSKNPDKYKNFMDDNMLPYVYRQINK